MKYDPDQDLLEVLDGQIAYYRERIKAWAEKLLVNPAYAFEWSSDTIREAAKLEVCATVLRLLKQDNNSLKDMIEYARNNIHGRARAKPESTSAVSNLVDDFRLEAWVIIWEVLNSYLKKESKGSGE